MIPWIRARGNPLALVPCTAALVAAVEVVVSIFMRQEWGTGRDLSQLLLVAALLELALVLDLVLQGAVLRQHMTDSKAGKSRVLGWRVLQVMRYLQGVLLAAPIAAIISLLRWPSMLQTLQAPYFTYSWVLLSLNVAPVMAGYLLLWIISSDVTMHRGAE
jgi:hypothetical protein